MRRLAWKELRENLWMLLITLLWPLGVFLLVRTIAGSRVTWNQGPSGGLLLIEFVIFGAWGAMRMSSERATGWLTLRTLPVRVWQVWLLKLAAAVPWAAVCAVYIGIVGWASLPGTNLHAAVEWDAVWMFGAGLSLCYSVGFTASLFCSGTVSGVLGGLGGTMGLMALSALASAAQGGNAKTVIVYLLYWLAVVAVLSLWAMAGQARGVSGKRLGFGLLGAWLVVAAVLIVPRLPHLGQTRAQFYQGTGLNLVPCPGTDRYATAEFTCAPVRRGRVSETPSAGMQLRSGTMVMHNGTRVDNNPSVGMPPWGWGQQPPTGMRLWLRSVDGKRKWLVESGDKRFTPLAWTSDRQQLIYLSEDYPSNRARLMRWNPRTGKSAVVAEMDTIPIDLRYWITQSGVAAEPGGDRIAFARVASGRSGYGRYLDLWVKSLRTGEERLLWPNIGPREVLWRAGRIYLRSWGDLTAISPEGGRLEEAQSLPPASRGEAR